MRTLRSIRYIFFILFLFSAGISRADKMTTDTFYLLKPDRVFDGDEMHMGWQVLVNRNIIEAVGEDKSFAAPAGAIVIDLKGCTLLPGLIEGHSHLFLHPYNETSWDNQVLLESTAERIARATVHARNTLLAGFTTVRDLGTEGAMYSDVGLKEAINKKIIPGPRMIVATRAIVATGSYGPKGIAGDLPTIKGAAEADGVEALTHEARIQIGKGADLIKIYADYYWAPGKKNAPTFSLEEIRAVVVAANSAGRMVVAHASTEEGMRRAILAGVGTIEHGDAGTPAIFQLMKEKGVAYCPTISALEAVEKYHGWRKGVDSPTAPIIQKKQSFTAARESGVIICMGGDVGVFAHGDNAREMEAMVEYGMKPVDVLRSATSVNASVFQLTMLGRIKKGFYADIIAVQGNPAENISAVRNPALVMKDGVIYKK